MVSQPDNCSGFCWSVRAGGSASPFTSPTLGSEAGVVVGYIHALCGLASIPVSPSGVDQTLSPASESPICVHCVHEFQQCASGCVLTLIGPSGTDRAVSPTSMGPSGVDPAVSLVSTSPSSVHQAMSPVSMSPNCAHQAVSPASMSPSGTEQAMSMASMSPSNAHQTVSPTSVNPSSEDRAVSLVSVSPSSVGLAMSPASTSPSSALAMHPQVREP